MKSFAGRKKVFVRVLGGYTLKTQNYTTDTMGSLQQTDEIDDGPKEFRHQRKAKEAAFFLHPSVGRDINHVRNPAANEGGQVREAGRR